MATSEKRDEAQPDPFTGMAIQAGGNPHNSPLHFPEEDHLKSTKSMEQIIRNAKLATDNEHKMTLWQSVKLYPKAVGWSILISTCICMEGYDVCLLSNFCMSSFLRHIC